MKFIIFKHLHYAFPKLISLWTSKDAWEWNVKFHKSCYWDSSRNQDDYDLNKLCGISFGWNHHKNSVRVTWVPDFENPSYIDLYGYIYDPSLDGHLSKFITTVPIDTEFKVKIDHCGEYYAITAFDKTISTDNNSKDKNWGFRLYPYFGGNSRSPKTMKIYLNKVK